MRGGAAWCTTLLLYFFQCFLHQPSLIGLSYLYFQYISPSLSVLSLFSVHLSQSKRMLVDTFPTEANPMLWFHGLVHHADRGAVLVSGFCVRCGISLAI
jgi:hypothetical protein